MIVVIDYGLGNLASVYNALAFLGAKPKLSASPDGLKKADKAVLPGVGACGDAVSGLKKRGLAEALREFISSGGIYLGICLGLQVLFEESEEGGGIKGLGILRGKVGRFREKDGIKVPHIGWNRVAHSPQSTDHRLMDGIEDGAYFYFDHSYYAEPADNSVVAAKTDYGVDFASMICRENIYAVQFHPERSQGVGLRMLENFIKL